jgi:hypothetical protein
MHGGPFMPEFSSQASPENESALSRDLAAAPLVSVPRKLLLWLALGVAGTVLFPTIYMIEGVTISGYNAWQQAISALSLGPYGWIQQADFVLCGVSVLWSAFVWRKILKGGVCATWYPLIRAIEGIGLIAIGIFSQDPGYGYPPGTPAGPGPSSLGGTLHLTFTILVVQAMCLALFIIARRFWKNSDFRGWTLISVAFGLMPMVFMPFFGFAQNTHSSFAGYAGLFERLATNADTIWGVLVLIPLWAGGRLMQPINRSQGGSGLTERTGRSVL